MPTGEADARLLCQSAQLLAIAFPQYVHITLAISTKNILNRIHIRGKLPAQACACISIIKQADDLAPRQHMHKHSAHLFGA
jgi:hypothetical protein